MLCCQGDCTTGENYCYSTDDGKLCANCKIFGDSTLPSCFDYGAPQGGIDGKNPGSKAWRADATCDADGELVTIETGLPCLGRLMYSEPKLRIFSGRCTQAARRSYCSPYPAVWGVSAKGLTCAVLSSIQAASSCVSTRSRVPHCRQLQAVRPPCGWAAWRLRLATAVARASQSSPTSSCLSTLGSPRSRSPHLIRVFYNYHFLPDPPCAVVWVSCGHACSINIFGQVIGISPGTTCLEHEHVSPSWSCGEESFACSVAVQ